MSVSPDHTNRTVIKAVIAVSIAALTTPAAVAEIRGDVDELKPAAQLYLANKGKIETWTGRVLITDVDHRNSNEVMKTESQVRFFYDRKAGALRWEWDMVDQKAYGDEQVPSYRDINGLLTPEWYTELLNKDSTNFSPTPREVSLTRREMFSVGPRSNTFDPMYYFGYQGEDVSDRFLFLHDKTHSPDLPDGWSVKREGEVLTVSYDDGNLVNRYVVNLSMGGTLQRYEATTKIDGQVLGSENWQWTYKQTSGIWIPSIVEYDKLERFEVINNMPVPSTNERRTHRTLKWVDSKLNSPISPKEFELTKIGVKDGDVITDTLAGTTYRYNSAIHSSGATQERWGLWRICFYLATVLLIVAIAAVIMWRHRATASDEVD